MRAVLAVVAFLLVACGAAPGAQPTAGGDSMAMCVEGATECIDTVVSTEPCPPEGCSAGGTQGSTGSGQVLCDGPDQPAADAPAGTDCSAPDEPQGRLVKPAGTDGLSNVAPIGWDRSSGKGRKLTVHWWSGVEPCHVFAKIDVVETRKKVTVTLYEGSADPDAACVEIAEALRTRVRLQRPLGDRTVVDGSRG